MDGDSESKSVSTSQQQQQACENEKIFVQLQHNLLGFMKTEQEMRDKNEANFQLWNLLSTGYIKTCNNLVKVVNADFEYSVYLQDIGRDKNSEVLKTRCRMLDSYELMMVISQSLQRIHFTFTKFLKEQNKSRWEFQLIMSYTKDLEKKMKSTDQWIKSAEDTIKKSPFGHSQDGK